MLSSIKEIDSHELAQWLDSKEGEFRVIDVREFNEIAAGTVPNAEPMPMATIPMRLNDLDRNKELVFICRSGARSAQVCMFLQQQGFNNVTNLRGGMIGWAGAGLSMGLAQAV